MSKSVLVVGDVIVDRYVVVGSSRKAAEGGLVWKQMGVDERRLGGAANVAMNLKALGGDKVDVFLAGICDIQTRRDLMSAGISDKWCAHGEALEKTRFCDEDAEFVFRFDGRDAYDPAALKRFPLFFRSIRGCKFDAVVFSDYDKGTLDDGVIRDASPCSALRVVDSKRLDLRPFSNATVLKLNETEHARQVSHRSLNQLFPVEALFGNTVVTRGRQPTLLIQAENASLSGYVLHTEEFPVVSKKEVDVTGCGDTHTATMTYSLLFDPDMRNAVRLANQKASEVVGKFGTSVCSSAGSLVVQSQDATQEGE